MATPTWTPQTLAPLPRQGRFRLRGTDMSRLETFTDAAFAFAVTLLVISVDDVPGSFVEFTDALTRIPAFLACFVQLMLFWWGHHRWSRRYGLEDGWSIVISLALVAAVLIYIYPLRVIFGAFFANATADLLPAPFPLTAEQVGVLFIVFGFGFALLVSLIMALFMHAYRCRTMLVLSPAEELATRIDIVGWGLVLLTGVVAAVIAIVLPPELKAASGYTYWTLAISMPLYGRWAKRQARIGRE